MIPMKVSDVAAAVGGRLEKSDAGNNIVRRVSTDSRDIQAGDLFVAIRGPRYDGHDHIFEAAKKGAVACFCSKSHGGEPNPESGIARILVDDTVAALGRLAAHYRSRVIDQSTVVVAVTGSNGKTTTKCMIDHILGRRLNGKASPKSYNNSIGLPLTLLSADANDRFVASEIGTNAPGEISALASIAKPDVAVITSIGEAHLEKLGGLEGVAAEKASIFNHVRPGGLCVVNVDRPEIHPYVERIRSARLVTVGTEPWAKLQVTHRCSTIRGTTFELDGRFRIELPMPGSHHATNAAAAFAVARWFGLEPEEISEALKTFTPPDGRTRWIDAGGITIVDDAYNANPSSVCAAVKALQSPGARRRVFVLGDMLELGDAATDCYRRVIEEIAASTVDVVVTVGAQTLRAVDEARTSFTGKDLYTCGDVAAACGVLDSVVTAGDTVWVKASRSMGLGQVVAHLHNRWSPRSAAVA
ncbi:MAG: UDP-N-acetylmuramoyl-tripeptide--D-alanyl-D-alanine ligase [Planctomycetes bacterium]|nr:UDP-N-acetylmuramoyl-tripeptide--D-alanyl-D-alanine ligase [Planctomycetota bacterium]